MSEVKRDAENIGDLKILSSSVDRRMFLQGAAASGLVGAASLALPNWASGAATAEDMSVIQKEIETPLARKLVAGAIRDGQKVVADERNREMVIEVESAAHAEASK